MVHRKPGHDWGILASLFGLFMCVMAVVYGVFQFLYPWLPP